MQTFTVTEQVPVYDVVRYRHVPHELRCASKAEFFEAYYQHFDRCAPIKRGRFSMPKALESEYRIWRHSR